MKLTVCYSLEGEPQGTYHKVKALLERHALKWSYEKPIFTFEAEGAGLATLMEAGLTPDDPWQEEPLTWTVRTPTGQILFKALCTNKKIDLEAAINTYRRAISVLHVQAEDKDGVLIRDWLMDPEML